MVSEASSQMAVVRALRKAGVLFCAVPNGGRRDRREAVLLKRQGVEAGVPDLLVFDAPPAWEGRFVGLALELKQEGTSKSRVSVVQRRWLVKLQERGWRVVVAFGAEEALAKLREAGYAV